MVVREQITYTQRKVHFGCANHAPTASIEGMNPSFSDLSNRLISSTDVAFAIAAFTLSASSLDIRRPALPGATAGRGSSVLRACFAACVVTVDANVVASWVSSPSAVRNRDFACCLSYNSSCEIPSVEPESWMGGAPCHEFSGNLKLSALVFARQAILCTISFPGLGCPAMIGI